MKLIDNLVVTQEGWLQMQQELASLRDSQRARTSQYRTVLEGIDPGEAVSRYLESDIADLDRRIAQLEDILANAIPVGEADQDPGVAGVGCRVTVRWEDGEEESFLLVGPPEVRAGTDRISYESPVGKTLMGRRPGEWVEIEAPGGTARLEIIAVE